jgi:hypothetical protein
VNDAPKVSDDKAIALPEMWTKDLSLFEQSSGDGSVSESKAPSKPPSEPEPFNPIAHIRKRINRLIYQIGDGEGFFKNKSDKDPYYQSLDALVYAEHLLRSCVELNTNQLSENCALDQELIDLLHKKLKEIDAMEDAAWDVDRLLIDAKMLSALSHVFLDRKNYLEAMLAYVNALELYQDHPRSYCVESDFQEYSTELLTHCLMNGLNAISSSWVRYGFNPEVVLNPEVGASVKHLTMPTVERLLHNRQLIDHVIECLKNQGILEIPEEAQLKADMLIQLNSSQVQDFLRDFEQKNRP